MRITPFVFRLLVLPLRREPSDRQLSETPTLVDAARDDEMPLNLYLFCGHFLSRHGAHELRDSNDDRGAPSRDVAEKLVHRRGSPRHASPSGGQMPCHSERVRDSVLGGVGEQGGIRLDQLQHYLLRDYDGFLAMTSGVS